MPSRVRALESRLAGLEWQSSLELKALQAQASQLLSQSEVSPELIEEYRRWKECNPVPPQPLVSVCVATYNRARVITERCIPSILQQTYPRLEVIVVGDGCTDETEQAIARIRDDRLRFVNLPQRGTYPDDPMLRWMVAGTPAVNHTLSLARGHYVTHLDDDDEYTPDRLERLVDFASSHDCDFVWHPFWLENGLGQWELREALDLALGQVTTSAVFYRWWFTKITWNIDAYRLREPGDWNRFRRIKYIAPALMRYPEPLLRHYREGAQRQ
jgi:glycosyltransferase involved in cell wall biosynthesis